MVIKPHESIKGQSFIVAGIGSGEIHFSHDGQLLHYENELVNLANNNACEHISLSNQYWVVKTPHLSEIEVIASRLANGTTHKSMPAKIKKSPR